MPVLSISIIHEQKYPLKVFIDDNDIALSSSVGGKAIYKVDIDTGSHKLLIEQSGSIHKNCYFKYLIDEFGIFSTSYKLVYSKFYCTFSTHQNCALVFEIKRQDETNESLYKFTNNYISLIQSNHIIVAENSHSLQLNDKLRHQYIVVQLLVNLSHNVPYIIISLLLALLCKYGQRPDKLLAVISLLVGLFFLFRLLFHMVSLMNNCRNSIYISKRNNIR